MKITVITAAVAALAVLSACGSDKADPASGNAGAPIMGNASGQQSDAQPMPGPPVTDQAAAASQAYANSDQARSAINAPPPQIAGIAPAALDQANELAVCRIAFAVKHGEAARAPSDIEKRAAAFDLASNPKALQECKSRP